jgi:DprA winged helix domain
MVAMHYAIGFCPTLHRLRAACGAKAPICPPHIEEAEWFFHGTGRDRGYSARSSFFHLPKQPFAVSIQVSVQPFGIALLYVLGNIYSPRPFAGRSFRSHPPAAKNEGCSRRQALRPSERPIYDLLSTDAARHVDELFEKSGLTSSEALATLFDLERKGVVRQLPGKQFLKVLL